MTCNILQVVPVLSRYRAVLISQQFDTENGEHCFVSTNVYSAEFVWFTENAVFFKFPLSNFTTNDNVNPLLRKSGLFMRFVEAATCTVAYAI